MATDREDLLDIQQAAQFLNVSETSLRRWTNSGRLACLRVGRKRERRFRRVDLLAFAEEQPVVSPLSHPVQASHMCGLYASDLSRVNLAVAFLADGLQLEGSLNYLAVAPDARDDLLLHLKRRRPSLQGDVDAGRLVVAEYAESVAPQMEFWETQFGAATRGRARSFRVVGDVSGGRLARRNSFDEVLKYETEYDRLAQRFPVATLCLYDARTHSGLEVLDVLKCHQDVFQHPVDRLFS